VYIIHFYGSGFTTLIRFNYWILCETVLPGQGGVPRLAEVNNPILVLLLRVFLELLRKLNTKKYINVQSHIKSIDIIN
jgi:hypothetical protein